MGITLPTWGSNIGKTRPQKDYVRLDDRTPDRLELESVDAVLARRSTIGGTAPERVLAEAEFWKQELTP